MSQFMQLLLQFMVAYFIAVFVVNLIRLKKRAKKANETAEKFISLSKEELCALSDQEVIEGASFRVSSKYNKLHGLSGLTEPERNVLTYDQMKICCQTAKMSINNFFADQSAFVLNAKSVFDIIGAGKESFEGAYQLYLNFEEEYKKDINEVIDELDNEDQEKNFVDYSNELKAVFNSEEAIKKMADYIRENVDDFYKDPEFEDDDNLKGFMENDDIEGDVDVDSLSEEELDKILKDKFDK